MDMKPKFIVPKGVVRNEKGKKVLYLPYSGLPSGIHALELRKFGIEYTKHERSYYLAERVVYHITPQR